MIVDREFVGRVELAITRERQAFALGSPRERPDGAVLEAGSGLAVFTGADLFSNRVIGLGLDGPVDSHDLGRVEEFYRERGLGTQVEVPSLADRRFLSQLGDRGYRVTRFRNIYAVAPPNPGRPAEHVDVQIVDDTHAGEWSDVLIDGFGYQDPTDQAAVARWNRGLLDTDGVHALVARLDDTTVGSASIYISDGAAVLGGATTLMAWRDRGVQSALIVARLNMAHDSGCEIAIVTADPGSTSGRNAERAGFQLVCTHAVLAHDE
jgi:hypothetical protein